MTKVAVIGVGGWGKNHARLLKESDCLAAICDLDAAIAKELASKHGVPSYSNVDELLSTERPDGCLVCTPTRTHAAIASKVMEHGINVFVEKPMSYSYQDCKGMMQVAKDKKVILTAGYIERFNPAVRDTRKLIESRQYGEAMMIEFHRESRMPLHIKDVGIIYDTAVHDIDTALFLFGARPKTVFAIAGRHHHSYEDFSTIMLGFEGQKVAMIASNWLTPKKVRKFSAVCTEAIISGNFITQQIKIDHANATTIPRRQFTEPLKVELENFIQAIEGKAQQVVSADDATEVTRIAEAALLSSNTSMPVSLS